MVRPESVGWWRRIVVIGAIITVTAPVVRDRASFPLSTYPIYANTRERNATIITASGTDVAGRSTTLGLAAIAATDDPLIAQSTLDRAVASGGADELCRMIALRAGAGVVTVEIAREQHDLVARARDESSLRGRDVVSRCEVRS